MLANKTHIQSRFNRASASYEEVAHLQKACAQTLMTLWQNFAPHDVPDTILDVGTGTGHMVEALLLTFPDSQYCLNDMAPNMIALVEKKWQHLPQFSFQLGDMEKLPFEHHNLIMSNFALQWASQLNNMIKKCYDHSDYFIFSTLLSGTFREWRTLLRAHDLDTAMPSYPDVQDLKRELLALKPKKYQFLVEDYKMTFNNATSFITYLKKLGAGCTQVSLSFIQRKRLTQWVQAHNQPLTVTYQVFLALLKRG